MGQPPDDYDETYDELYDGEPYDEPYEDVYEEVYDEPYEPVAVETPEAAKPAAPAPPQEPVEAPRRKRSTIRVLLLSLAILLLVVVLVMLIRQTIFNESGPSSEFSDSLTAGYEPDFTEGNGWPDGVDAAAHTLPAIIKNELAAPAEQHGYQFEGEEGQAWMITVEASGDSLLDPVVSLYGPAGTELVSNDDRTADDFDAALPFVLPQSGTYRLLVESSQGGITTGSYLLTVMVQ
ncbi:MAG: hypothetical protein GXY36_03220 [Chloroflexi bacterium]|nr:hypothetical protein [Chloroflexota bacterium]